MIADHMDHHPYPRSISPASVYTPKSDLFTSFVFFLKPYCPFDLKPLSFSFVFTSLLLMASDVPQCSPTSYIANFDDLQRDEHLTIVVSDVQI